MDSLFTPMNTVSTSQEDTSTTSLIIDFLCKIEGWKTKIKNLHWSAPKMNIHKELDDVADFVSDFQDALAEDCMGFNGKFQPNILKGTPCDCLNAKDLIKEICYATTAFYDKLPEDTIYKGIKSETETFIHNINKHNYLISLCDVTLY